MTEQEARDFIANGRAGYDIVTGWQIAHMDMEWFSVNEQDAELLERVAGYPHSERKKK